VSSPFTRCGRWSRRTSLALASLIVLTPCAILTATLPGNGNNGFIDIGSFWLWQKKGTLKPPVNAGSCSKLRNHGGYFPSGNWISACLTSVPRHPDILINGSDVRKILVIICGLLAVAMVGTALANHDDHGLLFGSATVFFALTAVAACVSVFARKHVEDQAGRTFVVLVALSLILLVLAAHDWARRQLVIAAVVVAAALSMFIVRVGFESLKVPPQWERSQVASRAMATENALSSQYKDEMPALRTAVADARTALNDIVHGRTPPNVAQVVLTTANTIINNAKTWPATGKADNSDDFSQFDKQVANEDVRYPPAATAALADAVHALQAAETAATKPADMKPLDQTICVINPPPDLQCPAGPVTAITTNLAWVTDRHELDVQLATYRAQVTGTQADQSALQAVLAQRPAADEDISLLTAIENGPETLWRSAFHAAGPALVPGPLGWVVFGVLLLGLLSWLLKVNASQLAGPVSVADVEYGGGNGSGNGSGNGKAPGNGKDQLTAALRVAVLQNVAEPGAAPGSPSTNPVTTLLDIAGGPLSAANKIVQAVQAVVGQRFGYRVTIDVTTGNLAGSGLVSRNAGAVPATAAETSVLVRVMSLTSGVTYASHLCEAPDELEAVWTAGLWAAGYILNRSSRIPHWAAWEAETAHALVTAKHKAEHTIPDLRAALADAPNSGILLVLLGHRCELAGQMLDAIGCYARAVTAYPRYSVARYRLAAALALMRHAQDWRSPGQAEDEDDMRRAVRSAVHALEVHDHGAITDLRQENPDKKAFEALADMLLWALESDTWWAYRLVGVLRRSERASVWPALTPFSQHPAARFPDLVRSARRALSDDENQLRKLYKKANKQGGWWQISYNAACAHATKIAAADSEPPPADTAERKKWQEENDKEAGHALDYLEQTLVRMGVEQLSADWVSHDPDLTALRDVRRFKRFVAQLRSGG
jgi:hypothetical protein